MKRIILFKRRNITIIKTISAVAALLLILISSPLFSRHSAFKLENIRPTGWNWPIGSMAFMSNGDLIVSSWKDPYEVHRVTNVTSGNKGSMQVTTIASGLREMLGMQVINDSIYVAQKDEITLLLDHDNDGLIDEFRCIAMDWTQTTNEKNYSFGMVWDGKHFYIGHNGDLISSATLREPQPAGRQNAVWQISRDGREANLFAGGLRVPSGMGLAYGEVWLTENQGGYRPNNPLINVRKDRWYGRQTPKPNGWLQPFDKKPVTAPDEYDAFALAMEHTVFMRSPGTPDVIPSGPYAGHMLIPDATVATSPGSQGIRRIFMEKVDGEFQGAAFHFIREGFEGGGVWDIVFGPDGNLYAGANGSNGSSWGRNTHIGFDRLVLNNNVPFEMKAIRNLGNNSFEMEFTKPIGSNAGTDEKGGLSINRYWDELQDSYGGGRRQQNTSLNIASAIVSNDRTKLTITVSGLQEKRNYHFQWNNVNNVQSASGENMLYDEAWYTLNNFGPGEDATAIVGCGDPKYVEFIPARDGTDNNLCQTLNVIQKGKRFFKSLKFVKKQGVLELKINNPRDYKILIKNFNGQEVPANVDILPENALVDVSGLRPGIFIITATKDKVVLTNKFTVVK